MSYAPRYIIVDGVWYMRRDHVADQLTVAIESAFKDGMRFAGHPAPLKRAKRGAYRTRRQSKIVEAVV